MQAPSWQMNGFSLVTGSFPIWKGWNIMSSWWWPSCILVPRGGSSKLWPSSINSKELWEWFWLTKKWSSWESKGDSSRRDHPFGMFPGPCHPEPQCTPWSSGRLGWGWGLRLGKLRGFPTKCRDHRTRCIYIKHMGECMYIYIRIYTCIHLDHPWDWYIYLQLA